MIQNIRNPYSRPARTAPRNSISCTSSTRCTARICRRMRSSKRASRRSRWLSRCRWRRPTRSIINKEPQNVRDALRRHAAGPADAHRAAAGRTRRAFRAGLGGRLGSSPGHRRPPAANARAKSITPLAALLTDLKQRGLLDSTLVIWGGEFGRTADARPQRQRQSRARSQQQSVQHRGSPAAA